jgi:hypothetical protein
LRVEPSGRHAAPSPPGRVKYRHTKEPDEITIESTPNSK